MITSLSKSRQQIRRSIRTKNKSIKALDIAEALLAARIKHLLRDVISADELCRIARETKFLKRSRKLTEFAVFAILLMGCFNATEDVASLEIMSCFLRKWFDICIQPQSLQDQINSKECADFIKKVAIKLMMHEANKVIAKLLKRRSKSKIFNKILLQDSTVISLPETVSRIFRGCGGSASKAAVKCDVIIDQNRHLIIRCKCISGRIPDPSLSGDILNFSEENDLVIRDMGYFNLSHFTQMSTKKIKFISRLKSSVHVYLNRDDANPVNIINHLQSLGVNKKKIDMNVYLGKEELIPVRLIAVKVPQEVINKRKDQYIKAHCRKSTPSEDMLEWYGYTLMITNIPREDLLLRSILRLYKVRWQIELFFKNMKSQLKIDNFTGENKYRILCLLYIKLILTWITALLFALAEDISANKYKISAVKFTRWLRDVGEWQKALTKEDFTELIEAFERDMNLLRKKPSRYIKRNKIN